MDNLFSKPHKLIGKIQNYKWGTKNDEAYIPNLLGIVPEQDVPYAEYWIGVHPKAPSEVIIDNEKITLIDLLQKYPGEILGERVANKFGNTLPFLLKILSINQALSIQAHPDKILAKELHKKDLLNYPDENHKPEIAIAIDYLRAIVGLKKISEVKIVFRENPELLQLLTDELAVDLEKSNSKFDERILKSIYNQIMYSPKDKLEKCISEIKLRLGTKQKLSESEKQFLAQYQYYGIDVGLISILLFNIVQLKEGEAIYTSAGIPHAYLKGNIVECMANSDNVVRAGLTPKYKDVETLLEMLEVDSSKSKVELVKTEQSYTYRTDAEEFEVEKYFLKDELLVEQNDSVSILLLLEGSIKLSHDGNEYFYQKGDTVLLPASMGSFTIQETTPSLLYSVHIP